MGYKTAFGGYTPDLDLASSDWTKRWNTSCTALVRGVAYEFVGLDFDAFNDSANYTFSGLIPAEGGRHVVGIVYQSDNTLGIQGVSVDGQLGSEILEITQGTVSVAFWTLDPTSFSDGDINIALDAVGNRIGISVWRVHGDDAVIVNSATSSVVGGSDTIDTVIRNVLLGMAIDVGNANANDYFWSGVKERNDALLDGSSYWSIADKLLITEDDEYEIAVTLPATPSFLRWVVLPFQTAVTYFSSGQCVRFAKQSSSGKCFWSWDNVSLLADLEVKALVRPIAEDEFFYGGIVARGSGEAGTENGYYLVLAQTGVGQTDQVLLRRVVAGVEATIATLAFDWSLATNYWLKLYARGTDLKAKVWAESSAEPAAWMIEATDSDITARGRAGITHYHLNATMEVGQFEVRELFVEWPYDTVPFNWTVDMSGGPQSNKIAFKPDVGPTIDRRRATSIARRYSVECPGLSQEEYLAFVEFYHTTLKEGTLPFNARDPFTGDDKIWKFGDDDPAYQESLMRPVGEDFDEGLYKVQFSVIRLD